MLGKVQYYLDHNATTPVAGEIRAQISQWVDLWGNPSSIHWAGRGPKNILRHSRQLVAELIGADPLEVVFTSGGSEANNLAIKGCFASPLRPKTRNKILVSTVEHPSVMKTVQSLVALNNNLQGAQVELIPVSRSGQIDLDVLSRHLDERTFMVSVMYANNETGHIFPIPEIAKMAHAVGALVHCDGVQALGKVPVDVRQWDVDLASFSAHKFYALKGAGALYVRRGVNLESLIHGGGQERHRRAGTENILAIAAFGEVARRKSDIQENYHKMRCMRDDFEARITQGLSGVVINGPLNPRLPNTSSLVISGVSGETLLMNLDLRGFAVSTGAACSAGSPEPSPVLRAMGLSHSEAQSSLRVSLGWNTDQNVMNAFISELVAVVHRLRTFQTHPGSVDIAQERPSEVF